MTYENCDGTGPIVPCRHISPRCRRLGPTQTFVSINDTASRSGIRRDKISCLCGTSQDRLSRRDMFYRDTIKLGTVLGYCRRGRMHSLAILVVFVNVDTCTDDSVEWHHEIFKAIHRTRSQTQQERGDWLLRRFVTNVSLEWHLADKA